MRQGGKSGPNNREPERYGKTRRSKAEETNCLKTAVNKYTYKQQQTDHLQVNSLMARKKNVQCQEGQGKKSPGITPQNTEKPDCLVDANINERIHLCTDPARLPGRLAKR